MKSLPVTHKNGDTLCPVCDCRSGEYAIEVAEFRIYKCPNCGLEYTSPNPTDDELMAFYEGYSDIRAREDVVIKNAQSNIDKLIEYGMKKDSKILDYGTGNGDFVRIAGENCFGIELNNRSISRVFSNLKLLPIDKFDFITLWGVLEHLNDPVKTMRDLSNLLTDGGKMVITTVDAEGIIPYYYKPIEHLTYWTRDAFIKLFDRSGLRLTSVNPYIMIQARDIYVDRLLSRTPDIYKRAFHSAIDQLPEYVHVPTNEVFVVAERDN